MRKSALFVALVFILCLPVACRKGGDDECKQPEVGSEADISAIKALIQEWIKLYNAGDFERMVSVFYAEKATLLSPGEHPSTGAAEILAQYRRESLLNDEHVDSSLIQGIRVSGSLASAWGLDSGLTTPRDGSGPHSYVVKWLMTFERQPDASWKCLYEMWDEIPSGTSAQK